MSKVEILHPEQIALATAEAELKVTEANLRSARQSGKPAAELRILEELWAIEFETVERIKKLAASRPRHHHLEAAA